MSVEQRNELRRRKVVITGIPHFIEKISRLIANNAWAVKEANIRCVSSRAGRQLAVLRMLGLLARCDLAYQIGGPTVANHVLQACVLLRKPLVLHWVGSDVLQALRKLGPSVRKQHLTGVIQHWADAPWLADELGEVGIGAQVVPLSAISDAKAAPMAQGPLTVLLYLPNERFEFYNGPLLLSVARRLPDIQFVVVGGTGQGRDFSSNVTFLGWVDNLEPVYGRCHVFLRVATHDGMSFMVTEALARGRYVIWNHAFPGVDMVSTLAEIVERVQRFSRLQSVGLLAENSYGRAYAQLTFSTKTVADGIRLNLKAAIVSRNRQGGVRNHVTETSRDSSVESNARL